MSEKTEVRLSFTTDKAERVAKAIEVFSRTMTGLALDGIEVTLTAGPDVEEADVEQL